MADHFHKAGSRKAQVHSVFDSGGPDAALKLGIEMGLKPGTIKSWMGSWKKDPGTVLRKQDAGSTSSKRRKVWMGKKEKITGVVTEPGKEVSGVKWDNGVFQYCPNNWLHDVEEE
jgi:hypothetical protein